MNFHYHSSSPSPQAYSPQSTPNTCHREREREMIVEIFFSSTHLQNAMTARYNWPAPASAWLYVVLKRRIHTHIFVFNFIIIYTYKLVSQNRTQGELAIIPCLVFSTHLNEPFTTSSSFFYSFPSFSRMWLLHPPPSPPWSLNRLWVMKEFHC